MRTSFCKQSRLYSHSRLPFYHMSQRTVGRLTTTRCMASLAWFFSVCASAQGLIGTYAHMTFVHEFACVSHRHLCMSYVRQLHRVLGKTLLAVAVVQISLGLQRYDATVWSKAARGGFNLATAFFLYTLLAWMSIAALEYRHRRLFQRGQKNCKKDFQPLTGAGYCSQDDLRLNTELYFCAIKLIDSIIECENVSDPWACIKAWVQQGGKADFSSAANYFCVPMRFVYLYGHRSMKTSEIIDYCQFLEVHYRKNRSRESALHIAAQKASIDNLLKGHSNGTLEKSSRPPHPAIALELSEMTSEVEVEL